MKQIILSIFIVVAVSNIGISCSCFISTPFFNNIHVRDHRQNCIVVLDSLANYPEDKEDLLGQTGYFTIIDTLSEMNVSLGQSILVFGQDGVNCGESINQFTVGDTLLLSLIPISNEDNDKIQVDTFYLDGCGVFYLPLSGTEYADWTSEELRQSISEIMVSTSTEESSLAKYVSVFPNPSTQNIFIQTQELPIQNIQVYNSVGAVVLKLKGLETNNQAVVISQLDKGFYILEINTLEGTAYKKILKI